MVDSRCASPSWSDRLLTTPEERSCRNNGYRDMESAPPPTHPDQDVIARLVVDSARDVAIFTTDLAGRVTSWNEGAEHVLGWSEQEMLDHDSCVIFTPEDLAADACHLERATADREGRAEDERWHVRKDGQRFWASGLLMQLKPEPNCPHIGYVKILRARTRQHKAREELAGLHERTADILESISDAFNAVDSEWRFTYLNRRTEELWGRSRRELLGKIYWD
jgi:PAS domain S-box-containing protein